ncbi:uncharacterized membrane protein YjfL (UPF0719 family) [Algoriphagus sp. 4150]|uniref:hypothetical protein n=1 Tax=Algoriphagus sp. 4150 TaxID=2817756 RepID=UPI002856295C|nr:hypothetical protein [Algoriphagus sp. 4150]MDR7131459.1 uncharacterized membrane protein YjfL (UPF0719 family) [Algoriphagus sp. 4150]
MGLGKNDNEDYEYSGSPKKQYIVNTVLAVLLALLMFWVANYFYNQLVMYEKGETIHIQDIVYMIYLLAGKWSVAAIFMLVGFGFLYAGYTHFKKYQEVKNKDF